jgi:hypothetical protein
MHFQPPHRSQELPDLPMPFPQTASHTLFACTAIAALRAEAPCSPLFASALLAVPCMHTWIHKDPQTLLAKYVRLYLDQLVTHACYV